MNAKEGSTRPGALGRGLDTLMGNDGESVADIPGTGDDISHAVNDLETPYGAHFTARAETEPTPLSATAGMQPLVGHAGLVGGLIAGGAAGAVAIAAFSLLGVKAVLSMSRR